MTGLALRAALFLLYVFWCTGAAGQMEHIVLAALITLTGLKAVRDYGVFSNALSSRTKKKSISFVYPIHLLFKDALQ